MSGMVNYFYLTLKKGLNKEDRHLNLSNRTGENEFLVLLVR